MVLYTEEAATEEECISKILRVHKIERHDFKDMVKIVRIRRVARDAFLGIIKKNVVEITYFVPQHLEARQPQAPARSGGYSAPVSSYAPAQAFSAPAQVAYPAPQHSPLVQASSFDENKKKLLDSVLEANPDIRQKVSSGGSIALVKSPSRKKSAKADDAGKDAKKDSGQLDLLIEDDPPPPPQDAEDDFSISDAPAELEAQEKESAKNGGSPSEEIEKLIQEVRKIGKRIDMTAEVGKSGGGEHRNISKLMDILELNDFTPSFMGGVRERIRSELTLDALSDFEFLQRKVLSWMGECIKTAPEYSVMRPHLIALVGPTGAGKTTTIAKLAASYIHAYKKTSRPLNVRAITIDNYRIGARQQLEEYGEIMGVTVASAGNPHDLHKLISLYQDADIVLIDTIGRSPKDHAEIAKMRAFFEGLQASCETLLAVSACTKASDLHDIIRQYGVFPLDGLIITKFDETSRVGNIISMLAGENLPLSYITTGQLVPHDFEVASAMKFLLALQGFSVDILGMQEEFPYPEKRFEWS